MTVKPLVSILTPSFNQARFLRDCLESVSSQSYAPIEHIVADGGSSDESVSLLERAGDHVRWWSTPDNGQGDALNRAFQASKGEIIGWINSDDALFDVGTVGEVVRAFEHTPEADVIFGNSAQVGSDGLILRHIRKGSKPNWHTLGAIDSPLSQPATFVRRRAIHEAGGYMARTDLELKLDIELWFRLHAAGARFVYLNRVLGVDREHAARKTRVLAARRTTEAQLVAGLYGVRVHRDPFVRIRHWARRAYGAAEVLRWEQRYEPAFPWRVDAPAARLRRQIAQSGRQIQATMS